MIRKIFLSGAVMLAVLWWWTIPVRAGGKDTVEVSVDELRRFNERLQRLEEDARAKDARIKQLEAQLGQQEAPVSQVASSEQQQETRLKALEDAASAPFGGEFSLMPGGQSGPFSTDSDFFIAGALDLPVWNKDPLFGQKLLGEIMIGYGRSTDKGVFTSPVSIFLPTLGFAEDARLVSNKVEAKFLQVFLGAKYKLVDYGMEQLQKVVQPYIVTGLGINVILGRTLNQGIDTDGDGRSDVSLTALGYPGGAIGGVVPEAAELNRRGLPTGQGNIKLAYSIGGGVDVKLTERIFVGIDGRYNFLDGPGDYGTYTGKVGFLW
ncbi:MAG: hypothetical protein AB7G75_11935 [Candidatus Binatia bacterium]